MISEKRFILTSFIGIYVSMIVLWFTTKSAMIVAAFGFLTGAVLGIVKWVVFDRRRSNR